MVVLESFEDFRDRQKCECIQSKGRYVFANGAVSTGDSSHNDPPQELVAKLRLQKEFLQAKHDWAYREFEALKQHILDAASLHLQYSNLPAPSPEGPRALRHWQQLVASLREQIANIDRQLPKTPIEERMSLDDRLRDESKMEASRLMQECTTITLGDIQMYSPGGNRGRTI